VNYRIYGGVHYWVLDQTMVHAYSYYEDSGSPVYSWNGVDSTVTFEGILIGSPPGMGDTTFYYSRWERIASEVFPNHDGFTVMNLAAETPYSVGPVGVLVLGPNSIGVTDTYEWDAGVYGGTGSNGYQWKYEIAGSSTWTSLGTSAYAQLLVQNTDADFTVRAIVSSGGNTDTNDLPVDVNPITSIDLGGPTWVHPGQVCHWTATPTGGNTPTSTIG
jgi:hypothetical protein